MVKKLSAVFFLLLVHYSVFGWGFYAHRRINHLAVFTLPQEMIGFYKKHIDFITEASMAPDKRRYAIKEEGCRHFIDLDHYSDTLVSSCHDWKDAVAVYGEDSLMAHGIVPWHVVMMKQSLSNAFREGDISKILRISADLGHYIADAHVPLHTTFNYNGQYTGQHGIHGLWESRLPELFADHYDFFVGTATYMSNVKEQIWEVVVNSHAAVDSVLTMEKSATIHFSQDQKYSFEERGAVMVKVYSRAYCEAYHHSLGNQVERQMRAAISMVGDIWYTAWIDAGSPDLEKMAGFDNEKEELEKIKGQVNEGCGSGH